MFYLNKIFPNTVAGIVPNIGAIQKSLKVCFIYSGTIYVYSYSKVSYHNRSQTALALSLSLKTLYPSIEGY